MRVEGWPKKRPSVRPGRRGSRSALSSSARSRIASTSAGDEVGDPQQVAAGERDGERRLHDQRSFAAATAAPTSPSRGGAAGAAARTCPPGRSRRPARARRGTGTPSRTSASAASVARRSGSAHAAASRSRSNSRPRDEHRQRAERAARRRARREHRRLVLLQVAVVGERQPLDRREQAGEPADRRAGLAARELGDVGVQLLRHHRRPGRRVLGQAREAELGRRPEHELLADPREVREQHRCRVEVVEREVAVGDGVDRVAHRVGRRRERRASSPRARRRRAATAPPARRRTRSARGRARASRPTRAGGGRP